MHSFRRSSSNSFIHSFSQSVSQSFVALGSGSGRGCVGFVTPTRLSNLAGRSTPTPFALLRVMQAKADFGLTRLVTGPGLIQGYLAPLPCHLGPARQLGVFDGSPRRFPRLAAQKGLEAFHRLFGSENFTPLRPLPASVVLPMA